MNSVLKPTEIRRDAEKGVFITWDDGTRTEIKSKTLRNACPCAGCLAERGDTSHQKPLSGKSSSLKIIEASAEEAYQLKEVWAIGNYAIGFRWGDGHKTGIYQYQLLRELARG